MDSGRILESGTHETLMEKEGLYHSLVMTQEAGGKKDANNNPDNNDPEQDTLEEMVDLKLRTVSKLNEHLINQVEKDDAIISDGKKKKVSDPSLLRIFGFNKPETCYILIGSFFEPPSKQL